MFLIISSFVCFLLGAATGIAIYRNNVAKLQAAEAKAKAAIDALKK